ncbi:TonB-dependent receptor [Nemorincola caseinilytica]|uniref:TonB-dependent receptor n=1 Tax=Nemorincola caseinilytica TaxID=2054315 RepID=A0ABP8N7X1_9BACT
MRHNRLFLLASAFGLGLPAAVAQDVNMAYYLANVNTQGTARSMGFGNALGSIGGDYSATSVNPAGLGIFRRSELSFTPSLRTSSASSQYLGSVTADNNVRLNLNSFGMVFTDAPKGKRYERRAWKAISFAFGMNRVVDLNRDHTYTGVNTTSSASQAFEADANQYPGDALSQSPLSVPGYLGYQAYLLNQTAAGEFYSIVPYGGGVRQSKTIKERGRVNEYTISLGGNYREQLMLGATLGIPSIKYSVTSSYSETLAPGNVEPNPYQFSSFRYDQQLDVTGVGINLKVGAIYKIDEKIRVGAALHSPSYYALDETYTPGVVSTIAGTVTQVTTATNLVASNRFNYSLTTPWRGILSASYIFKGKGFITADYEYADYGFLRYTYPISDGYGGNYDAQETAMNDALLNKYGSTSNFRIGGEALLTKFFMARAGFGYYGNPYRASGMDGSRMDISGGIGFRSNDFFADIALVHSAYSLQNAPYSIDYSYVTSGPLAAIPMADTKFNSNNIAFTVGVKF